MSLGLFLSRGRNMKTLFLAIVVVLYGISVRFSIKEDITLLVDKKLSKKDKVGMLLTTKSMLNIQSFIKREKEYLKKICLIDSLFVYLYYNLKI